MSGGTAYPPSSLRNSTTATEISDDPPASPQTVTVNITPMTIPIEPSTPSHVMTPWPPTPYEATQTMFSPSPAPAVTPRIYSWNHRPLPRSPTSPSSSHGSSGPLTNPSARMSLPRISIGPTRVHVQNA
jgi:hypothetical protein